MTEQQWMTPAEARAYLGVNTRQLHRLQAEYGLPFVRFTTRRRDSMQGVPHRYIRADLDDWAKANPLVLARFAGTLPDLGYVTQSKLCKLLRVKPATVVAWREAGCPATTVGNRVLLHPDEVTAWLRTRQLM